MKKYSSGLLNFVLTVFLFVTLVTPALADDHVHPNDIARFIAGLEPAASSPLHKFAETKNWKRHSAAFDKAWKNVEKAKLKEARIWARNSISRSEDTMFYMFSGPDFLYANTFFPKAKTYILTGLEPVGQVSHVDKLSSRNMNYSLLQLRQSMNTVLNYSFFITKRMKHELRTGFKGTLPIMLVFMARSGKVIEDISFVTLNDDGTVVPFDEDATKQTPRAVKVTFRSEGEKEAPLQTLYYFSTDLGNNGVKRSGFLKFCESFGKGDSLVKSASYLMHYGSFSTVRDFLLDHSSTLLQDDSGIPVRHFDLKQWDMKLHGRYKGPISLFAKNYQRDLARLYRKLGAEKVKFGIGYRWRVYETNFLLATKK